MVRKIAYKCLKEIIVDGAYSNLVLKQLPSSLSRQDKALITQIVYGTLQNYEFLSYQWQSRVSRKTKKTVEIVLNMSCFQLFFLDKIPSYAVLSEANKLVRPELKSFVQAILLQCQQAGLQEVDQDDEVLKNAITHSLPVWIMKMWTAHYGSNQANNIAVAMHNDDHTLVARINPLLCDRDELLKDERVHFIDDWALTYDENLIESEYHQDGKIIIQDYSSQQVAKYLEVKPHMRVLDACSAPGTKSAMIAAMMENQGEIIACDLHKHRLELMKKGLDKWGVQNVKLTCQDMTLAHEVFENESFDRILLDVPCSGLGVLRHKPDIKFHVLPEHLDEIVDVQSKILSSCAKLIKKDGLLVYSTCTLNKKENERQVQQFLKSHEQFELIAEQTVFPNEGQRDGFYIAQLKKN